MDQIKDKNERAFFDGVSESHMRRQVVEDVASYIWRQIAEDSAEEE